MTKLQQGVRSLSFNIFIFRYGGEYIKLHVIICYNMSEVEVNFPIKLFSFIQKLEEKKMKFAKKNYAIFGTRQDFLQALYS